MLSIKHRAMLIITVISVIAVIAAAIIFVKIVNFVNIQNTKKMIIADISDILVEIEVLNQNYKDNILHVDVQADTTEKARLILEKLTDLNEYVSNNSQYFENPNEVYIWCWFNEKFDMPYPVDRYYYRFNINSPNEVYLDIDFVNYDEHEDSFDIFMNKEFPNINEISVSGDYKNEDDVEEMSSNFPDLKIYRIYNNRGEIVKEKTF
ncbi:MAG: hypothetical protein K2K44_05590 [Oscillospiraceae bacterium]|nr:hypothetical protein [Oscillospiraceae bacterium]